MKLKFITLLSVFVVVFGLNSCYNSSSGQPQLTPEAPIIQTSSTNSSSATLIPATIQLNNPLEVASSESHATPHPNFQKPQSTLPSVSTLIPVCNQPGKVVLGQFRSTDLPLPMDYRVYLPPCYEQNSLKRFPVLILIHGQSFTEDQWVRLGITEAADRLILTQQIPPLIMAMPRDRIWEQPDHDPFGQVLIDQFIPFIDTNYRTLPDRQYRAIGGLSRGAGWAIHLGLSNWRLFAEIGAHSLAVFPEDVQAIPKWLEQIPQNERPLVFLDIGNHDRPEMLKWTIWLEQLLTEQHYPHEWYYYSGFHDEAYWSAHVEQYLRWYTSIWATEKKKEFP